MASRLLGWRASRAIGARRMVHTSGARLNLFPRAPWGLFQKGGEESVERLGAERRRGGYERGGGMPLYVPVRAKNVEKAWEIWSINLRPADPAVRPTPRDSVVDLLMLVVRAAEPLPASRPMADDTVESAAQRRRVAAFRTVALLRHVFALAVREQQPAAPAAGPDPDADESMAGIGAFRLGLGLKCAEDYAAIAALIREAAVDGMPSGTTPSLDALPPAELEAELAEAPLARLAQLLVVAARDDGILVPATMLQLALEVAVAMRDTAAARDMLAPDHADLAALLDPTLPAGPPGTGSQALNFPHGPGCASMVETLLRLVAVGRDPQALDGVADGSQPQPMLEYAQMESLVDYNLGEETPEAAAAVREWRAAAGERIYRAYVSSGFAEVPSPDAGGGAALRGSLVPTPDMLASLVDVHLAAGHAEQAAVVYETLKAAMRELPLQPMDPAQSATPRELHPEHRVKWCVWTRVLDATCAAGNQWLAARTIGDMAGDGWAPIQAMYARYLATAAANGGDPTVADAVAAVHACLQENGVAPTAADVREPLVRALAGPCAGLSAEAVAARAEQALALSGLAAPGTVDAVSDDAARDVIAALIGCKQIARAQELIQAWHTTRPDLASARSVADLVRGLGMAGQHSEALALFAEFQRAGEAQPTTELLGAVLDVYMHAGDYAEAISVGKRIRALVAADPTERPDHTIYNHLVQAYCEEIQPGEALFVLEEMRRYQLYATPETFTILAIAMSNLRSYDGLRLVNALANVDYNMVPAGSGSSSGAPALPLTTDYYNALIEAYGRVAEPEIALQVWELMRFRGVRPNALTATLLINTCGWNERVHWEAALEPQSTFTAHKVPDDHVYTGASLWHMHFLADSLAKLRAAGLEFSVVHYQQIIEALVRAMCVKDPVDMLIGRLEDPQDRAAWDKRAQEAIKFTLPPLLAGLAALLGSKPTATEDAEQTDAEESKPKSGIARSMDDFVLDIPLCPETIATIYGALAELRTQCQPEMVEAISRTTLVSETGAPVLLRLIAVQERRLDSFLQTHRPDLLPASRNKSIGNSVD
ncbi:hypothetical protein H4R19_003672 [Coemansia spiralis]|nr:hypothetical protein H4R19_003672 [Coemansia spiralis]